VFISGRHGFHAVLRVFVLPKKGIIAMQFISGLAMAILLLGSALPARAEPVGKETALAIALKNNPRLIAALAEIEQAEGAGRQAALLPNPQAAFEIENFDGKDERDGFDGAEITLGIEQEIEIAGKRGGRKDVASHQSRIAREKAMAEGLNIMAETDFAFMRLVIAQERLSLAEKRLTLAGRTHETVKGRVSAAAASDIQHTKADIEQSAARLEKAKAEAELAEAQSALAALLAMPEQQIDIRLKSGTLPRLPDPPERAALLEAVREAPQARAMALAKLQAESRLGLAKATAVPNPTVGLGVRRFQEDDSTALIVGISFPLPVFDRNQGGIRQARAEIMQADALARQQDISLRQSAIAAFERLSAAHTEAAAYEGHMVPGAERAYAQASDGYKAGRFSFLDLLDAQRTLYEVEEARLQSLLKLYEAKAQTDLLMGVHAPLIQNILDGEQ